jgi:hypothetical protein
VLKTLKREQAGLPYALLAESTRLYSWTFTAGQLCGRRDLGSWTALYSWTF